MAPVILNLHQNAKKKLENTFKSYHVHVNNHLRSILHIFEWNGTLTCVSNITDKINICLLFPGLMLMEGV